MSVLIKGMEMPKSCFDCKMMVVKAVNEIEIMKYCCFLRKTALGVNRRKDCPLVEVPTPHGRLIDADSVEKQIDYVANLDWNRKVGASEGMFAALEIVEDALTIIESEGEDESR